MFKECCDKEKRIKYDIKHKPQPLGLDDSMKKTLDNLLWYIPNIDSFQSPKIELIDDSFYDDFIFQYLLSEMHMKEDDVKLLEGGKEVPESDWIYYENDICVACQKVIICTFKTQTKTKNLLRCIRNCIAHGRFAIVEDTLIGFNTKGEKKTRTAIIKIKPQKLLEVLQRIKSAQFNGMLKTHLWEKAFERVGYEVKHSSGLSPYDFTIMKDQKVFNVEIKEFKNQECKNERYIHKKHLQNVFNMMQDKKESIPLVLIIDKSRIVKDVINECSLYDSLIILDTVKVSQLLDGKDVLEDLNFKDKNIKV